MCVCAVIISLDCPCKKEGRVRLYRQADQNDERESDSHSRTVLSRLAVARSPPDLERAIDSTTGREDSCE